MDSIGWGLQSKNDRTVTEAQSLYALSQAVVQDIGHTVRPPVNIMKELHEQCGVNPLPFLPTPTIDQIQTRKTEALHSWNVAWRDHTSSLLLLKCLPFKADNQATLEKQTRHFQHSFVWGCTGNWTLPYFHYQSLSNAEHWGLAIMLLSSNSF